MMEEKLILLVEDNPDDADLTVRAFKKGWLPCRIDVVCDGSEALDYLFCKGRYSRRSPGDQPNLILMDLKLPKIGGLEVIRRIRADERTQLIPIIILTSSGEEQDLVGGYRVGANSYIRKTVNFDEFVEAVNHLGLYWLVLNEPPPVNRR